MEDMAFDLRIAALQSNFDYWESQAKLNNIKWRFILQGLYEGM